MSFLLMCSKDIDNTEKIRIRSVLRKLPIVYNKGYGCGYYFSVVYCKNGEVVKGNICFKESYKALPKLLDDGGLQFFIGPFDTSIKAELAKNKKV